MVKIVQQAFLDFSSSGLDRTSTALYSMGIKAVEVLPERLKKMRGIGVISLVIGVVLDFVLLSMSGANVFMDSELKVSMLMWQSNPVLMLVAMSLFFGGFAMIVFGDNLSFAKSFNRKRNLRHIIKNERKRQEAIRKQNERLNR